MFILRMSGVAPYVSFCSVFAMLICRYLSEQLRQNIVLLGQQVVAICIAPRDAFILNRDACLLRLAWILTVFEMIMTAKFVSEVITRIGVSLLLGSGTNLAWAGSVVGVATGYGLNGVGIETWWRRDFCTCPDRP
jgi:hypothetical protein